MNETIFCPKCGSILIPKKSGKKIILKCSCGYSTKNKEEIILKEKIHLPKKDKIEVIDRRIETLPKTNEECKKCHNKEAYFWTVQTRSGDEAETRFFKCTKCMHTWRAYD